MANKIEIFSNNTKTITCIVSGISITGYTPYLTVKDKSSNGTTYLSKVGYVLDPSTAVFYVTSTDSSIVNGTYVYDITIEKDTSIYTVVKDTFCVLDAVRY